MKIAVYCGAECGKNQSYLDAATETGRWIASKKHTLIYGGGNTGLMGTVAKEVFSAGCEVIAVIPQNVEFIASRLQPFATKIIKTVDMSERKHKMLEEADAFIALPGGIGTLDEISEVMTLTKIGVFNKKSVLFNKDGFYEPLKNLFQKMIDSAFMTNENLSHVIFAKNTAEIENFLQN